MFDPVKEFGLEQEYTLKTLYWSVVENYKLSKDNKLKFEETMSCLDNFVKILLKNDRLLSFENARDYLNLGKTDNQKSIILAYSDSLLSLIEQKTIEQDQLIVIEANLGDDCCNVFNKKYSKIPLNYLSKKLYLLGKPIINNKKLNKKNSHWIFPYDFVLNAAYERLMFDI